MPQKNALTGKLTNSDPRQVIDALARRDPARMLIDGLTAVNDLGLTTAVPARIIVHTDARLRPVKLGNQTIIFKPTAPTKLYWAGRPAMRVVQALYWLRDILARDKDSILRRLTAIFDETGQGAAIVADLRKGFRTLRLSFYMGCAVGLNAEANYVAAVNAYRAITTIYISFFVRQTATEWPPMRLSALTVSVMPTCSSTAPI